MRDSQLPNAERTHRRIGLVGCVKTKANFALSAKDLYVSPLFKGRRRFVEITCDEWWILSALHGLVRPEDELEPYDVALMNSSRSEKQRWSRAVLVSIDDVVDARNGDTFELHAGADYRCYGLEDGLRARGFLIDNPTKGLRSGEQLSFYSRIDGSD
jgi:hypothetical protein